MNELATHSDSVVGLELCQRLRREVLEPIKKTFVGKDEVVDLLGLALIARENLFIFGPPGTAKSAVVQDLARRLDGRLFDYLLTRFTEPNEIFGPFDIRQLREGNLVTNTEGMLPEANVVFLDELLNANSALLNSLLMVLNERTFRRGRENRALPTLMVVGASNHLPEDDALRALFDRFLLRVNCGNVSDESLTEVLLSGWLLEQRAAIPPALSVADIEKIQALVAKVSLTELLPEYLRAVRRLRSAGFEISDRRAVKLQRVIAASALLCGRLRAESSDLWVLRYIWDSAEQQEVLNSLVGAILQTSLVNNSTDQGQVHPRASQRPTPDAEQLAQSLDALGEKIRSAPGDSVGLAEAREQYALFSSQVAWLENEQQRGSIQRRLDELWCELEPKR
jgi:MoxR-like ATPase